MANQTVLSAAAIWQGLFDTLTSPDGALDFTQSGEVYFVDGNFGIDTNSGKDWEHPFLTLKYAITVSNANIASGKAGYASRNKIYVKGDKLDEDLTTFPQKCDVIGVGSCDAYKGAGIIGNHAPTNSGMGTRFININFFPQANADIIILTSSLSGVEFIGCTGIGVWSGITAPSFIQVTASPQCVISNCKLLGGYTGNVIDVCVGDASGMRIVDNKIVGGADNGIVISGLATVSGAASRGLIARNFIQVADKVIDTRAVSVFNCYDNIGISGEGLGGDSYVIDKTFAVRNVITGGDASVYVPSLTTVA